MRTRTRSTLVDTSYQVIDTPGGTTTCAGFYSGGEETIMDESHPSYRQLMKAGNIVMGPVDLYKYSREAYPCTTTFGPHPSWGSRQFVGDVIGRIEPYIADPHLHNAYLSYGASASLLKAYAAANSANMLMGELLSDLDKTVAMVRKPLGNTRSLLGKISRRRKWLLKRSKVLTVAQAAANAWLECRYGWRPIISDMGTIIDSTHVTAARSERRTFRGGTRGMLNDSVKVSVGNTAVPQLTGAEATTNFKKSWSSSSGVIVQVSNLNRSSAVAKSLGLRPCDIPATLWEIIPYSFVVDWFVGIGTWISALTPNPDVTILSSWTTTTVNAIDTTSGIGRIYVGTAPSTTYYGDLGTSTRTSFKMTRVVNPSLPTTPPVKPFRLSPAHAVDALSLLLVGIRQSLKTLAH